MSALASGIRPLPPVGELYELVPMLTTSHAVDLFLGDLQRRSRSHTGRTAYSYGLLLDKFVGSLRQDDDVTRITSDDCRRFLDRYIRHEPGYQHTIYATLNSFLAWLYKQQRIRRNPLDHVARPRRVAAEDLNVTTISTPDVAVLLRAALTHTERLAVAIPAYLGPRRHATAILRRGDYDPYARTIRFREKGRKAITKPVPDELAELIDWAIRDGEIIEDTDYLIPPEGVLSRKGDRDDRVIWRVVKRVAARAGVDAHVHALRAAFAVFYLEQHPNDIVGLQTLLGHKSIETTRVYLRKLNKQRAMEPVRTLSWIGVAAGNAEEDESPLFAENTYASSAGVGAGGFEPPQAETAHDETDGTKQSETPRPRPAVDRRLDALEAHRRGRVR